MLFGVFLVLSGLIASSVSSDSKRPQLDGRIVGGNAVTIDNYPYQVSLQLNLFLTKIHICGAAIISNSWIITSAECIIANKATLYKIRAGSTYRNTGGTLFGVAQIIVHSQWQLPSLDYNYAVIKIKNTFTLGTPGINSIALTDTEPTSGTAVTVSGWGALSQTSTSLPKDLQAVDVTIIDRTTCDSDYFLIGGITSNMICAADTGKDFCFGDYGGPLVDPAANKLVGTASWGFGCANPSFPGVYSSISSVRTWITQQTGV